MSFYPENENYKGYMNFIHRNYNDNEKEEESSISQIIIFENDNPSLGTGGGKGGNPVLGQENSDPKTESTKEKTDLRGQGSPVEGRRLLGKKRFSEDKRENTPIAKKSSMFRVEKRIHVDDIKIMIKESCSRKLYCLLLEKFVQWKEVKRIKKLQKPLKIDLFHLEMIQKTGPLSNLLWLNSTVRELFNAKIWNFYTLILEEDKKDYNEKIFTEIMKYENDQNIETKNFIKFLKTKIFVFYEFFCGEKEINDPYYYEFFLLNDVLIEQKREEEYKNECRRNAKCILAQAEALKEYLNNNHNVNIEGDIKEIKKRIKEIKRQRGLG